jgi:ABC-type multidrug transport system ATPase subunit
MTHPVPLPTTIVGIEKALGGRPVLRGVSLDLDPGTLAVVGGTNGSGKSTLLRCLAGTSSFSGEAWLGDHRLGRRASAAARRLVGYLPQSPALPETGTVEEVIRLFARLRGADPAGIPLPDAFLPPLHQRIGSLSGGQAQRVAIAAALLGHPSLLLLDEPTANLDEAGRSILLQALASLSRSGTTVLVASPAPGELAEVAHLAVELREGAAVTVSAPTEPAEVPA